MEEHELRLLVVPEPRSKPRPPRPKPPAHRSASAGPKAPKTKRKRYPPPLTPKRPAENTDDNYLRSLHIAVFVVCAYEATFILLPIVISSIEIGITIAQPEDHQYFHNVSIPRPKTSLANREIIGGSKAIQWVILVLLLFSAAGTLTSLVLLQLGLHRYRDILILPYLILKVFRMIAFTSGEIALVIIRIDYWYIIPILLSDLIMGVISIDIVWRTKVFIQMMARRKRNKVHNATATRLPSRRHNFMDL